MGASVKPEVAGTPIKSGEGQSSSPKTPETSQPGAPATEGASVDTTTRQAGEGVPAEELRRAREIIEAQDQVIREQAQGLARANQQGRELDGRMRRLEEGPPPSREQLDKKFWESPTTVLGEMISSELKKTVGPLNERFQRVAEETELDKYKKNIKAQYGDNWALVEPAIDQFVEAAQGQGVALSEQLVGIAAASAFGTLALQGKVRIAGQPPEPKPADPSPRPAERPAAVTTPPHLRPSAPQIPGKESDKPARRELTENERRLARERRMTEDQYLDWLETPPEQVIHSRIGKEQK